MNRALIVDDKPENLYLLRTILQSRGFAVDEARHGAEALTKARQSPPDIIVSDLLMPVMDGYTLLRHWKADDRLKALPFVVFTATYTEPKDERLAMDLGADAFILKPTEPEPLVAKIEAVLARARHDRETPTRQPSADAEGALKEYGDVIIRKLEEKALQLEQTNRALQEDIVQRRAAEAEAIRLRNESDQARAVLATALESQRTVEQALREQQALLQSLAATIPDHIYFKDRQSRFIRVNPSMASMMGLKNPAEAIGKSDFDIFSEEHARQAFADEQRLMATGEPIVGVEEKETWPDGHVSWVSTTKIPLRDAAGQITGLVGVSRDITGRKADEARLRVQAECLDKATDGVVITDLDQVVTFWNHGAERIFGYGAAEIVGRSIELALRLPAVGESAGLWRSVAITGQWRGELAITHRNGQPLAVVASITQIHDDAGRPAARLCIISDVTEQKKLQDQFMRAQRLENIGMLAAGIAHDLNNVLAPVLMASTMLRKSVPDGELRLVETIEKSAERGAGLVRQILGFAHGVGGEPRVIQVRHIINDIVTMAEATFPKSVRLEADLDRELWPITANPTQIHQVFLNLCVNARDAMPAGGTLSLRASNLLLDDDAAARLPGTRAGAWIQVEVADTGTGISPEIVEHIWEPFFTTKGTGKGTGLGLATVRGIVATHQGAITLESKPGHGTVFRVLLPAERTAAMRIASAQPFAPASGRRELILVVDDEQSIRDVAAAILLKFNYRVLTANDGIDGWALFQAHTAEIRLVITDLDMPNLGGADFASRLVPTNPAVKVIAITGADRAGVLGDRSGRCFDDVLMKPFTAEELLRKVQGVLPIGGTT
ncbi:MAG TPA: response regulator [Lacunisphaera sp.]|nr:response regulator [Lacunisphaera sp.]